MEQRRLFLFFALSAAVWIAWQWLVVIPESDALRKHREAQEALVKTDEKTGKSDEKSDAKSVAEKTAAKKTDAKTIAKTVIGKTDGKTEAVAEPKEPVVKNVPKAAHDAQTFELGSLNPASGYLMRATVTTAGAAVEEIALSDERYRQIDKLDEQLRVVGTNAQSTLRTFETSIPAIDEQLLKLGEDELAELGFRSKPNSRSMNWVLVPGSEERDASNPETLTAVEFSLRVGDLEARKRIYLAKPSADNEYTGYQVMLDVTLINHAKIEQSADYVLQGAVGLPLENKDNTSKFKDIYVGFIDEDGEVETDYISAADLVEAVDDKEVKSWSNRPLKFVGVNVLYFAGLVIPQQDQSKDRFIASATPMVVTRESTESHSDISVELKTTLIAIPAGERVTHTYALFAGPKRPELLEPLEAMDLLDYGRILGGIAKGMLWLLGMFRGIGLPYWLCVICLTIVVRGALFPLSKKQAISARKMKDLQPKLTELKKKLGDDKEKMARAQMELFAKNGVNPLAGCLPLIMQLPIFIGLYTALSVSIELRLAPFLWIENLAAPDALFPFGFKVPLVGWDTFNLLPLLTICLFVVQQKMFMPPPVDEQQAMQYKMMNYMMIFFGFLFYKMPAGLCVYFIASSSWGMAERKILDRYKSDDAPANGDPGKGGGGGSGGDNDAPKKGPSFFERMLQMADKPAMAGGDDKKSAPKQQRPSKKGGKSKRWS